MLQVYENMTQTQKNNFSDIANRLLATTFLSRDKKDNKDAYYFVISFKEAFDEFFSILKYELKIDINLGTIMLCGGNSSSLLKLKRDETIILLILRVLYHEKLKETSINENIVISVDDIHEKYNYLEIKKRINKTDLISALRLFRRYNLIETVDDIQNSNAKLVVLPTILEAINTENVTEVFLSIEKITQEVKYEKVN